MYVTSQHVHLFRSANILGERLQVIPNGREQNTYISACSERMKLKSEGWLEKLSQYSIFLRQLLVHCPSLLRNVDVCMSYISFLLQISNGVSGVDNMMFTAVRFLAMQVEQCNRTVTGDYGFALLVQEIIILQTLSQEDTSTLASLIWGYVNSHRNLQQFDGETDALPPIHRLILLTRSNEIIQAASNSGILPYVINERDIFGRHLLELVLDEIPDPNLQSLLCLYMGPNGETDLFGRTSLHVACMNGYEDIAQWFLNNGDDPNARGPIGARPLHIAICYGYESLAFSLIKCEELDIFCTDDFGMTCLQYAQRSNFHSLARNLRLQVDSQRRSIPIMTLSNPLVDV